MATKAGVKKPVTNKKTTTTVKKQPKSAFSIGLIKEPNESAHVVTGKYVFFHVLYAVSMVIFAFVALVFLICACESHNMNVELLRCIKEGKSCKLIYEHERDLQEPQATTETQTEVADE